MGLITDEFANKFRQNGFAVVPGFLSLEEVQELKNATDDVLQKYCQNSPLSVFENQARDTYFAESGDKIRGFYEESVISPEGKLLVDNPSHGLNKVGHALHKFHPKFSQKTMNARVKDVVSKLTDIEEPVVMQSMVIFKHPQIGGTEPSQGKLIGFWIALDEASLENGCLHFVPGSHKLGKVYDRFVKNPDTSSEKLFIYQGGKLPTHEKSETVPAPANPGDLVLIDGLVIHQSEPNTSDKPRMAYTFHIVDGKAKWSDQNWLQPTEQETFMKL